MPPQQPDRLPDLGDNVFDFRAHDRVRYQELAIKCQCTLSLLPDAAMTEDIALLDPRQNLLQRITALCASPTLQDVAINKARRSRSSG
jgi:hypothetical protein